MYFVRMYSCKMYFSNGQLSPLSCSISCVYIELNAETMHAALIYQLVVLFFKTFIFCYEISCLKSYNKWQKPKFSIQPVSLHKSMYMTSWQLGREQCDRLGQQSLFLMWHAFWIKARIKWDEIISEVEFFVPLKHVFKTMLKYVMKT